MAWTLKPVGMVIANSRVRASDTQAPVLRQEEGGLGDDVPDAGSGSPG